MTLSRSLRAGTAAAILATLAIVNDTELWTRDTHFKLIQKCLPSLKLFQEPP